MRAKQRVTRNTIKVAETNLQIIEYMRDKSCRLSEICIEFRMSESGMRKYMAELVQENILRTTVEGRSSTAHFLYSIGQDEKKIADFVAHLQRYIASPESEISVTRRRAYKSRKQKAESNVELLPGTRIHLAQDDTVVPLRKIANTFFTIRLDALDEFFFSIVGRQMEVA